MAKREIQVQGVISSESERQVLTSGALDFVADLHREFNGRRLELLGRRMERQKEFDAGTLPDLLAGTRHVRESSWQIAPVPKDLQDRRVEITGPVDRKMVINALNSGAKCYMADFEDSHSPTWKGTVEGQANLKDAVRGTIRYTSPEGKDYKLNDHPAVLLVRPRGWHLEERHVQVDGQLISGSLFDFGLYLFHNAQALSERGTGPYFYLPKLESHLEARLWNDVFLRAQEKLKLIKGTIKATVLIETIPAAFEMEEILYELKDHSSGLNCGRWDYIFSMIKRLRKHPDWIFPDRSQVTMTAHCMHSYSLLAIQTCHKRGAHAMGGMAPQIPIKSDPKANEEALSKVRSDKEREASDGHDGTWVAHPGLIPIAMEQFNRKMPTPNQISKRREDVHVTAKDLLTVPTGKITEAGLRTNIRVGIQYMEAWLRGSGCVPLYNLMEDAATAEISRAQIWQWVNHPRGILEDGRKVTLDLYRALKEDELAKLENGASGKTKLAADLFDQITSNRELEEFLTLRAYSYLEE